MDSIYKLLDYVAKVSKVPITVDGEIIQGTPVKTINLSLNFFMKDDCYMCGKCCPNENTAFTAEGRKRIESSVPEDFTKWGLDVEFKDSLINGLKVEVHDINGTNIVFYTHPKDSGDKIQKVTYEDRGTLERCHWLFEKNGFYLCRIHPIRSITCGMPHLRFLYNSRYETTTLGVSQFGRNWRLKCPVEFGPFDEQSVQNRMYWLRLLKEAADDMGIETYLPEILNYLDSGKREPIRFSIKERRGLF